MIFPTGQKKTGYSTNPPNSSKSYMTSIGSSMVSAAYRNRDVDDPETGAEDISADASGNVLIVAMGSSNNNHDHGFDDRELGRSA